MTYQEFVILVDQTSNNFNWRYGQALMNVLYSIRPEKYEEIHNLKLDCYDNEDIVPEVLKELKNTWSPHNENTK